MKHVVVSYADGMYEDYSENPEFIFIIPDDSTFEEWNWENVERLVKEFVKENQIQLEKYNNNVKFYNIDGVKIQPHHHISIVEQPSFQKFILDKYGITCIPVDRVWVV